MATRRDVLLTDWAALLPSWPAVGRARHSPNVLLIYANDLGYGDLGCYGASRINTPNLDRVASPGTRFVNAHSPSATCTPSRYSMLTGDYAWRTNGTRILPGDAAALIRPGRFTIASMLRTAGYATGVVGKWHLGLGNGTVDWNKEIEPGPLDTGFDYSFGIPATLDRVPTVFVEDRHVVKLDPSDPIRVNYKAKLGNEPTGIERPDLLRYPVDREHSDTIVNGISRIGYMSGGNSARWKDEDIADTLLGKATAFIAANRAKPFFLYLPLADPHVPRAPHPRFIGASGMGSRGDAIVQLDWMVGELMRKLETLGVADNTLVLFNQRQWPRPLRRISGPGRRTGRRSSPSRTTERREVQHLRERYARADDRTLAWPCSRRTCVPGTGGSGRFHRVARGADGADVAARRGRRQPRHAGRDPGPDGQRPRSLVEDTKLMTVTANAVASDGARILALRSDRWKFVRGSVRAQTFHGNAIGTLPRHQLYDLTTDPGERHDLSARMPQRTRHMAAWLDRIETAGRSRP